MMFIHSVVLFLLLVVQTVPALSEGSLDLDQVEGGQNLESPLVWGDGVDVGDRSETINPATTSAAVEPTRTRRTGGRYVLKRDCLPGYTKLTVTRTDAQVPALNDLTSGTNNNPNTPGVSPIIPTDLNAAADKDNPTFIVVTVDGTPLNVIVKPTPIPSPTPTELRVAQATYTGPVDDEENIPSSFIEVMGPNDGGRGRPVNAQNVSPTNNRLAAPASPGTPTVLAVTGLTVNNGATFGPGVANIATGTPTTEHVLAYTITADPDEPAVDTNTPVIPTHIRVAPPPLPPATPVIPTNIIVKPTPSAGAAPLVPTHIRIAPGPPPRTTTLPPVVGIADLQPETDFPISLNVLPTEIDESEDPPAAETADNANVAPLQPSTVPPVDIHVTATQKAPDQITTIPTSIEVLASPSETDESEDPPETTDNVNVAPLQPSTTVPPVEIHVTASTTPPEPIPVAPITDVATIQTAPPHPPAKLLVRNPAPAEICVPIWEVIGIPSLSPTTTNKPLQKPFTTDVTFLTSVSGTLRTIITNSIVSTFPSKSTGIPFADGVHASKLWSGPAPKIMLDWPTAIPSNVTSNAGKYGICRGVVLLGVGLVFIFAAWI